MFCLNSTTFVNETDHIIINYPYSDHPQPGEVTIKLAVHTYVEGSLRCMARTDEVNFHQSRSLFEGTSASETRYRLRAPRQSV